MKTIEQAAKEVYRYEVEMKDPYLTGFKAGVEFAQRWISVEEEMPHDYERLLVKDNSNDYELSYHDELNRWCNPDFSSIGTITHWRPIEIK